MKTLAFYSGNNLTPDYGDKFITLDYINNLEEE